jgi:hypothetical protein
MNHRFRKRLSQRTVGRPTSPPVPVCLGASQEVVPRASDAVRCVHAADRANALSAQPVEDCLRSVRRVAHLRKSQRPTDAGSRVTLSERLSPREIEGSASRQSFMGSALINFYIGNNMNQRDVLEKVAIDIEAITAEELRVLHEQHRNGDIATALKELGGPAVNGLCL